MRSPIAMLFLAATTILSCGGDSGGDEGAEFGSMTLTTMMTSAGTDESGTTATTATTEMTGGSEASTSPADTSGSEEGPLDSSTGPGNLCDPVVPGGWNACLDDMGQVDNTLCMWMGSGESVGFVGCLTSSEDPAANVCFIEGCEDACDCFAPPTTGTAQPICAEILDGGGFGCGLDCSGGETCPDGMACLGTLCFWPAMP